MSNLRGFKIGNEYAALLGFYDRIPKAVLAAIAVSYATSGGDFLRLAEPNVAREWQILNQAGIVPQAPPKDIAAKILPEEDTNSSL